MRSCSLIHEQKIVHYGVSNFDVGTMEDAESLRGGAGFVANQVLYNLNQRGIEWSLLPWCSERRIAVMAYSPLDEGRLAHRDGLTEVARRHGTTEESVALAWTLRQPWVVSIPKASTLNHVRTNYKAISLTLSDEDLTDLDRDYPAPDGPDTTRYHMRRLGAVDGSACRHSRDHDLRLSRSTCAPSLSRRNSSPWSNSKLRTFSRA